MSRYQWPGSRRSGDNPVARKQHNARADGVLPAASVSPARAARSIARAAPGIAPAGDANLWVPLGPSTVLKGQAGAKPHVAGRVRDIWVSKDGQRAYAASANGGVWFTPDAGNSWSPLGNWLATPGAADVSRPATTLTCGCLLVNFGDATDASGDEIYAATGELIPDKRQGTPGGQLGGIGVLRLSKSVPDVLADPFGQFWDREAKNLANFGIYRLARHPTDANQMVAATSVGLYKRTGAFVKDSDWTQVNAAPFNFLQTSGKYVTDVLWVATTPKPRLFVALIDASKPTAAVSQLWVSEDGPDGPYNPVTLANSNVGWRQRLTLAVAPSDPSAVYVLGSGPRLWRINGTTPGPVQKIPNALFGTGNDQSGYDMAMAVHPDDKDTIMVGGSTVKADGQWGASLFRLHLTAVGAGFNTDFVDANQADPAKDPTFIGNCVHADVHQVRYLKVGADIHTWVTCDGGVFRSTAGGNPYTFIARNTGLAITETDYVACHPQNDAFVIAGAQDNGMVRRVGDSVWQFTSGVGGDSGGVCFHPLKAQYFVAQYNQSDWNSNGTDLRPVLRSTGRASTATTSEQTEDGNAGFYSGCDARAISGKVSLALGTNRVWLTDNWDPQSVATISWSTVPTNSDPRSGASANLTQDTYDKGSGRVICCKWVDDNRLVALIQSTSNDGSDSAVLFFKRKTGGWEKMDAFSEHSNKSSSFGNGDIDQPTSSYLPPLGAWSDLAVHDPSRGTRGSLYVAATGDGTSDRMDTLWWYNGADTWFPTGLRNSNTPDNQGTKAPAYAVIVDPDGDHSAVFVGTALGVWRGQLSFDGTTPKWKWAPFSNGLPEAAIQDISFHRTGTNKLLRASIQARGVWEVDLSAVPAPTQRTYLRVHPNDSRRRDAAVDLTNPMFEGPANWRWYASPDIRIRPAPLEGAETVPFPGVVTSGYQLWIFQTALHTIDPLCRPTGEHDPFFDDRLKKNNPAKGLTIDQVRWDATVTKANAFSKPWDGTEPTEADLYELIVEDSIDPEAGVVPPPPPLSRWPSPPPVSRVVNRKHKVDVLVHYRDLRPLGKNKVTVTLLQRVLPATVAQWGTIAIADAWKSAIEILMSGGPFGGALPDTWQFASTGPLTLPLTSDIDARTPRAATFDVNFAIPSVGQYAILLAIVHSDPDKVTSATLTGATLRDLVLSCHQVAARIIQRKA